MREELFISVVVPVHNGGTQLAACLDALDASTYTRRETIVADDCSTDESAELAAARGCEVVRLASRSGPAAARNRGAARARGDLIVFVDADVCIRPDTLSRFASIFRERPQLAAVFGSYDDAPPAQGFFAQYKNLFHHYVHQQGSARAETFWAGCGAVRREAFEASGGFDERRYPRPSIEDIELGIRMRRAGREIALAHDVEVRHLKRWTLLSLLRSDIRDRALPWSRLILESGAMVNDLNLRLADRVCAALAWAALALIACSILIPALIAPAVAALAVVLYINRRFYLFFLNKRGALFAARAFGMHLLYYLYSSAAFALCYARHALRRGSAARSVGRAAELSPDE